jgi:hypothetical protein
VFEKLVTFVTTNNNTHVARGQGLPPATLGVVEFMVG